MSVVISYSCRTAPVSLPSPPGATVTRLQMILTPPAVPGLSVSSVGVCPRAVTAIPQLLTRTVSVLQARSAGTASVSVLSPRAVSATRSRTTRTISVLENSGITTQSVSPPPPAPRISLAECSTPGHRVRWRIMMLLSYAIKTQLKSYFTKVLHSGYIM